MCFVAVILSSLLCLISALDSKFPPNFLFGSATSNYQVEGGWNADGKGENTWDRYIHSSPDRILDRSNGDVAADSYNKWEEDVAACAEMGLNFYRFSISWARILPTGFSNNINKAGVKYYNNLINALLENNIEPMVTLFHFTIPQKIQDLGGWTNALIVDWFASYAEVVFNLFADRVKVWITINEPASICDFGYTGKMAPGIDEMVLAPYLCNRHVLLAHAKVWRIYAEQFKSTYHGRVSIANHLVWYEPASKNMTEPAELAREFLVGRYSHPIYSKEGGWPPKIEKIMANLSMKQGLKYSRLPSFTHKEKEFIKGTYDFYAMNYYTSRLVRKALPGEDLGFWFFTGSPELDIVLEVDPKWETGSATILSLHPPGIRKQLAWLKKKYGNLDFVITENGFSSTGSDLNDRRRVDFIHEYLKQILLSIKKDNVNVTAYTYWSLIDSFEWIDGFRTKFGLYNIDFNDPDLRRISRTSADYYASIIKTKTLVDPVVYHRQKQSIVRYTQRKQNARNGGQNFIQNGLIVITFLVLVVFTNNNGYT